MSLKLLARILIIAVIGLMIVGSALVLSASSTYSALKFHNNFYHMFISHLGKVAFAFIALIVCSFIPYDIYKKYSKKVIMVIAGLLFLTFLMAAAVKGASRWISLGFISFQPSELAKIVLLIHVAYLIECKGKEIEDFKEGFLYPVIWIFAIAILVFIQPNVSTSIIITSTSFAVLFIGGARLKHIIMTLGTAGSAAAVFAMILRHSRERILTFINSIGHGGEINLQVAQAKIALGSGGLLGIGLGQSRQSDLFLPESYGDFIFSVLGEELGFAGVISVLVVYFLIFLIGVIIAKKAKDQYGQLLAFGLSFTIILSAFINAAVVTGVFPTTGIPLPFISYGGTSIILMCASAGILVNIAHSSNKALETKKVSQK
ncbi:MAG: FtsW/RodA/SpoVE family cell cycle protein [Bacillota bacterium]